MFVIYKEFTTVKITIVITIFHCHIDLNFIYTFDCQLGPKVEFTAIKEAKRIYILFSNFVVCIIFQFIALTKYIILCYSLSFHDICGKIF